MQRRSEELQLAVQEYLDVDWTSVKYYLRRQIAKCVQECKSQASNAKRIARSIKNRQGSQSGTTDTNGDYYSGDDSDGWGSDFDDESDDEEQNASQVCELNNNTIIQPSINASEQTSSIIASSEKSTLEKFIPKPPDVPVIPAVINGPVIRKICSQTNCIPRPPVKRPPGQPPPPPVLQVPSQDQEQEDYEIPIVSTAPIKRENSELSDSSFHSVISSDFAAETYELIEPPEETYEMVDAPSSSNHIEKPVLPPRIPLSSGTVSPPPPLPQKPKKLKDNMLVHERPEGIRTFTRPKPPMKIEGESESIHSSSVSNIGFIGTLIGRRSSNTSPASSSPKVLHKNSNDGSLSSSHSVVSSSDGFSSRSSSPDKDALHTVGRSSFVMASSSTLDIKKTSPLPPLPTRGAPVSDETAQNMATRPLPPVPMPKEEKSISSSQEGLQSHPWFHEIERQAAEEVVKGLNESGSFVVRPSKRAGADNPYSLTIFHDEKLFHLNIRRRPDDTFALGKEKKKEKTFLSVADLISFHQAEPILLTSRGEPAGKTVLSKFPEKSKT